MTSTHYSVKYTLCLFYRVFVGEQRQVPSVESGSPLCPGAEGVQSSHHCRRNYAACELC